MKSEEDIPSKEEIFRDSIFSKFSTLEDPRNRERITHKLSDVLFMTICAILCGANNIKEIATYAKRRESWLTVLLSLSNGVPCYVSFWWILVLLDPEQVQESFINWVQSVANLTKGKVRAIDGKTLRGTNKKGKRNAFVHIVSMWACTEGLSLGMVKVDDKSNEITAIPKLLEMIDIKGTIITIDAMGTQTAIARQIQDNGGDYILALKGNHSTLHNEVENFFEQAEAVEFDGVEHSSYHIIEQGHGRTEKREVYVTEDIEWLPRKEEWKGLKSLIMIVSKRTVKEFSSTFRHYYISSLEGDARTVAHSIRSHWGIENRCHWVLDIGFREDEQQAHAGHIAENFAILRRIVLNLLRQDKRKGGIELKRKEAGWDPSYLLELLGIKSF